MLTFTAQQLVGGARYTTGVKIGNWNEDIARQEVAAKDYEARRSGGELLYLKKRQQVNFQAQAVPHSYSADGLLRYGQTAQLAIGSGKDARYLVCNAFMTVYPGAVRATAGAESAAQARNTVVIRRSSKGAASAAGAGSSGDDNLVRYGDRVYLECNPSLVADPATKVVGLPFLLRSSMANNVLGNTRKGRQEVVWTTKRDADAEWAVLAASGDRLMTDGEPVRAGDAIALLHCMSNVLLCGTDKETYPTDFGNELDIHCQSQKGTARSSMDAGGDIPSAAAQPANVWRFVLASEPSAAQDTRGFVALDSTSLFAVHAPPWARHVVSTACVRLAWLCRHWMPRALALSHAMVCVLHCRSTVLPWVRMSLA